MTMKIRVGIFSKNLSSDNPRGVVRVARAITDELNKNKNFEIHALGEPYTTVAGGLMVKGFSMADYLRLVPMVNPYASIDANLKALSPPSSEVVKKRNLVSFLFGWMLEEPWRTIGFALSKKWKIDHVTRPIYRFVKETTYATLEMVAPDLGITKENGASDVEAKVFSLNYFDAVVSFEAFEAIWDWWVEELDCIKLGYFHDAVPLRIYEGPQAAPDHYRRVITKMARGADKIACVSNCSKTDLENLFPAASGKAVLVLNGHDLDRFSDAQFVKKDRERKTRELIMVGDIDRRKNVQGVLRALPILARMLPEEAISLKIIGNSAFKEHFVHLEGLASAYANITWVGYLSDPELVSAYGNADVFVYASLWEGFGIPILEAMTAGIPVVASDLSSMPEVGGDNVFYCDPYDPKSIALAIYAALQLQNDDLSNWVKNATARAKNFTWQNSSEQLASVIWDVVAAKRNAQYSLVTKFHRDEMKGLGGEVDLSSV